MNTWRRTSPLASALLVAALAGSLSGCFPLAVVGVGTTALMVSDRRPGETQITDEMIESRASSRLHEKFGDRAHINVTSFNRTVLMTGEVLDAAAKGEAETIVGGVPNVKAITNEIQIAGSSSFGARSNDVLLTAKVKARFVDSKQLNANHVKVVTESSVVYLLGMVTHTEADVAAEIARTTGGVRRVVRAFEYVSEEQARELDNMAPAQAQSASTAASGGHP
jgi:osmotically-inducible protein OsmY